VIGDYDRAPSRNAKLLAPQYSSLQNSFLEFPKGHKALHVFHSIDIYRSIQMIDFVLEDSRLESLHVHRLFLPMSIKVGDGNFFVPGNETARVREAQASFPVDDLLLRVTHNDGIHDHGWGERHDPRSQEGRLNLDDGQPNRLPNLRRGESDTSDSSHGEEHFLDKTLKGGHTNLAGGHRCSSRSENRISEIAAG
jgi:hypothetical protein